MPTTGVTDLTVQYAEGGTALHAVTVLAEQGEILAVLGPSGSGKSTLLRAVAGLVKVAQGEVFIAGRRVTELPAFERRLAMVFEKGTAIPFLDVSENLGWGLRFRQVSDDETAQRVQQQAKGLRLNRLLRRMPKTLSSGELARVGIGHALVHAPSAFLFDEPLAHLDAAQRRDVRHRIVDVVRQVGVSALYVTHDQEEAMGVADRVVLLNAGRVVQIATPRELYDRPVDVFAASFVGSPTIGLLPARLVISGDFGGFRVGARTLPFWTPLPAELAALADRDVVIGVRPERVHDARDGSDPSLVTMPATVIEVQELGPDAVVTLEVAAQAVSVPGARAWETGAAMEFGESMAPELQGRRARLRSRFRPNTTVRIGDLVPVAVDVTRVHVFDAGTGAALWHPGQPPD
jgi:multiple sugar transport system ATP-binding protein